METLLKYSTWRDVNVEAFIEKASTYDLIAFDTETDMKEDNHLVLMQFALPDGSVYLYDWTSAPKLKELLETKTLIAHNAAFDAGVMNKEGIFPEKWVDTMLIEQIICGVELQPKGFYGLAQTLNRYFNIDMDKSAQTTFSRTMFSDNQLEYAAKDVFDLHRLYDTQQRSSGYNKAVVDLEMDFLNIIIEMHRTGFKVDVAGWNHVLIDMSNKYDAALDKLNSTYGDKNPIKPDQTMNWNSPDQVRAKMGFHGFHTPTTDKNVLGDYEDVDIVVDFLAFKEMSSQRSKLGQNFLQKITENNLIHTRYSQIQKTGRLASSQVNLQNIPKDYRRFFKPSVDGNVFVKADYSQQELIILGYMAGEKKWIETASRSEDLHAMAATMMFPEFEDADEDRRKDLRGQVKIINFSLSYGASIKKLSEKLELSRARTTELMVNYFTTFSKVEAKLKELSVEAKKTGISHTLPPFNRVRKIKRDKPGRMGRQGKNSPIQGSGADMLKLACNILKGKNMPLKFVHTIHDEILVECKPEDADMVLAALQDAMEQAGEVICPGGLIHTDGEICSTWGEIKE